MTRQKWNMYERHTVGKQRAVRDKKKVANSIVDDGVRQTKECAVAVVVGYIHILDPALGFGIVDAPGRVSKRSTVQLELVPGFRIRAETASAAGVPSGGHRHRGCDRHPFNSESRFGGVHLLMVTTRAHMTAQASERGRSCQRESVGSLAWWARDRRR